MAGIRGGMTCCRGHGGIFVQGKHIQWPGGVPEATTGQPARGAGSAAGSHTASVAAKQRPAREVPPLLLGPDDARGREFWDDLLLAVSTDLAEMQHTNAGTTALLPNHSPPSAPCAHEGPPSQLPSASVYREGREASSAGETRQPVLAGSGMAGGAGFKSFSMPLLERRCQVRVSGEVRSQVVGVLFGRSCVSYLSGAGPVVDTDRNVASMVLEALLKCPVDVRGAVASRVVLAGGGVMLPGFQDLLLKECTLLARLVPR
jgi:hypothetical protein